MTRKQLIILVVVGVIVGLAGWLVKHRSQQSWSTHEAEIGQKILPDFPVNDVREIRIRTKEKALTLKKSEDTWVVVDGHDYPADYSKVGSFLKDIIQLKVGQIIPVGKDDFGRLELNPPEAESDTGTVVGFVDGDGKEITALRLGKEHMSSGGNSAMPWMSGGFPNGRYLLTPQGQEVVLVSESFSSIRPDADSWLDKTFFKVEKIHTARAVEDGKEVWSVSRDTEGGELKLAGSLGDNEEVDKTKLSNVDSALRYPSFKGVLGPLGEVGKEHGIGSGRRFVATTFEGLTYTVDVGDKTKDGDYPLSVSVSYEPPAAPPAPKDETDDARTKREKDHADKVKKDRQKAEDEQRRYGPWVYTVASYVADDLLYKRTDLVKEKKKEDKAAEDKQEGGPKPTPPASDK